MVANFKASSRKVPSIKSMKYHPYIKGMIFILQGRATSKHKASVPLCKRLMCLKEKECFSINRWCIHYFSQTGLLRATPLTGSKAAPWLISLYNVKGSESFFFWKQLIKIILYSVQKEKAGNKSIRHQKCRLIFSGVLRNEKTAFSKVIFEM